MIVSTNEIVVGWKVTGQAELERMAQTFNKVTEEEKEALAELKKVNAQLQQTATEGKKAGDTISKGLKEANTETQKFSGSLKGVGAEIAAAFSVAAVVAFTKQLYTTTSAFEGLKTSIDFATGSQKEGAKNFQYLINLAQKYGKDLQSLAGAYSSFTAASNLAGIKLSESNKIFESAVKASTALGKSNEDTQGILLAFSQIVSKGTVQAEELRGQIGERLPGAFNLAAKAMGVTTKELNKMLEQGQVISADFLPKFAKELDNAFGEGAEKKMFSLTAALGRFTTAWDRFLESPGIAKVVQREIGIWTGYINKLRELTTDEATLNEEKQAQTLLNIKENAKNEVDIAKKKYNEINKANASSRAVAQMLLNKDKESYEALLNRVKFFNLEVDKRTLENVNARREVLQGIIDEANLRDKLAQKIIPKTVDQLKKEYEAKVKLLGIQQKIAELQIQLQTEAGFERDIALVRNAEKFGKMRLDLDLDYGKQGVEAAKDNAKTQGLVNRTLHDDAINLIKKESEAGHEASQKAMDDIKKQMQSNAEFEAKRGLDQQKQLQTDAELAKEKVDIEKKKQEKILEIDKKSKEEQKQLQRDLTELQLQEIEAYSNFFSATLDMGLNNYLSSVDKQIQASRDRFDAEIRLADGNEQKVNQLREKQRAKEKELRTQQFEAQRAAAIAQVIFKTAPVIAEYFATGVLAPLAVAGLAIQAAQIAFIASQPVPEFYKGVENFKGGLAMVGERGSEIIETNKGSYLSPDKPTLTYLPKGSNVITAPKTKERMQMLNSSMRKGQNEFVSIDTTPIARELSKMPVTINKMDVRGFTEFVRKGNKTTQMLNHRKGY